MSSISSSATDHLQWLTALQSQLSVFNAAILEHKYFLLLMGSYTLVAGTTHCRLKFEWDGREFFLNIFKCACQSQGSPQKWNHIDNLRIAPPEKVETIIERNCLETFRA